MKQRYEVIRDTREQKNNGWWFPESSECLGTVVKTMKTGDYTLSGLEDKLVIERKKDLGEVAQNINEKRFERELDRLKEFKYAYLLLGFTLDDIYTFPLNSGIPHYLHKRLKVTTNYIISKINYYKLKYPSIEIYLVGNRGREVAKSIFDEVSEAERTNG